MLWRLTMGDKLVKALNKKILRNTFIPSLGMYIQSINKFSGNRYELSVRYMDVSKHLKWGQQDVLILSSDYIISQFEILENADDIKSFEDGTWVLLKTIKETLNWKDI